MFDGDNDPVRPAQHAEQPEVRRPGAREHADRRLLLRAEHQAPAVQQPAGPAGDQLRGQPLGVRQDRRRPVAGGADLPDPAAQLPRPTRRTARTPRAPATPGPGPTWPRPSSWCSSRARPATKVVVDGTNDQVGKALAEQMVSDLNSIGYKATTQLLSASIQYPFIQNSSNSGKWNVGYSAWYQDYPARVGLPERPARLRHHPPEQRRQPEHRRVLRQVHPVADQPGRGGRRPPTRPRPPRCGPRSTTRTPTRRPGSTCTTPSRSTSCPSNVHGYEWNPQWYILIDRLWLS